MSAARRVRQEIAQLEDELPPGHHIDVLFDQSRFIERALQEVRGAALIGGILAILVLFFFLRDLRSTLIIATSIPLSLVATFIAMYKLDISLNIMSLGGLTLGIGMLVDNSIVVLESIFRRRSEGLSLAKAAIEGTTEVGAAVVASTLTTVAVFLPIVFVEGIAGQLFGDMSLTVTASLLASLIVAITVIPMLASVERNRAASKTGGVGSANRTEHSGTARTAAESAPQPSDVAAKRRSRWARAWRGSAPQADSGAPLGALAQRYDDLVRGAIARRAVVLVVAFGLFGLTLLTVPKLPTELIPSINEGEFFFEVQMPDGTPLPATDRVLQRMEQAASQEGDVASYYSTVGSRLVSGGLSLNNQAENLGQLNIVMKDRGDEVSLERTTRTLRESFAGIPDLEIKSGKPTYFSLKTPIEVIVFGENLDDLRDYSVELQQRVSGVPGLVDVRSSLEAGSPELRIHFDRDRLAAMGLDMRSLSETLRDRVHGNVPTRFKEEDRQLDIRVRNREEDRASVADIRNLVVPGPNGEPVRLLTVADITEDRGPAEIHRLQQQRAAVITANLEGRSLGGAVADVEAAIANDPPPRGLSVEIGGQSQEMQVSFGSLRFAIGLAIFLVYLVMAATFESLLHPFLVLCTIPLALIGVVAGLFLTSTPVSVIVLIGTIMLVGIVVNNAIVLIDAINQLRRSGMEKLEAVVQAGHIRLRPILMTTSTTVLGLLPMALSVGEGSELRAPLAITVCAGLLFSTILTLVVIPAAYMAVPSTIRAYGDSEEDEPSERTRPIAPSNAPLPASRT
ncbi:MAG: efflux RND transporter permease subunit [Candidatus Eisenbacteria bacterium]